MKTCKRVIALLNVWIWTWVLVLLTPVTEVCAGTLRQDAVWMSAQSSGGEGEPDKNTVSAKLEIDNENLYEGMERTYSQGYVPKVEQETVYLVVPLLCNCELSDNRIRTGLNLGDSRSMPFVNKNYEKTIPLQSVPVNNGTGTMEGYIAVFSLELRPDRYNGSYPVILSAGGTDRNGRELQQEFTIYVNITDGKNPDEEPATEALTEEPVTYAPKVMVEACHFSKEVIQAGDEIRAEITLINTSQTETIRNMTVTVNARNDYFTLLSQSDSIYVDSIPAGGKTVIGVDYGINGAAPQGQYDLEVSMNYADTRGGTYSEGGRVKVNIVQPVKMEFDPISIPAAAQVTDVVPARVQALNLGKSKAYNVRAVIEADGLRPEGSIFIGDIEPGSMASGSISVSVTSLSEGTALYGETKGRVTFSYEDEDGTVYEETQDFSLIIQSPFSSQPKEEEDQTGQWWVIMAVIAVMLCMFTGYFILRRIRIRKRQEERTEDEVVE